MSNGELAAWVYGTAEYKAGHRHLGTSRMQVATEVFKGNEIISRECGM